MKSNKELDDTLASKAVRRDNKRKRKQAPTDNRKSVRLISQLGRKV